MREEPLGICDKKQCEHSAPHKRISDVGQMLPPFACQNWHEVEIPDPYGVPEEKGAEGSASVKHSPYISDKRIEQVAYHGSEFRYLEGDLIARELLAYRRGSERMMDAVQWLMGCHDDGFEKPEEVKGNFWWRSEFARRAGLKWDYPSRSYVPLPPTEAVVEKENING